MIMNEEDGNRSQQQQKRNGTFMSIFIHADVLDWLLMIFGFLGAVGDGFCRPAVFFVVSNAMNSIGKTASSGAGAFSTHEINKNVVAFLYVACCQWLACFLEGYCWRRTGERQASALRAKYLKAVLRQDVGYFDVHVTSITEVITSVSSDSLIIQDVISEKVPVFLMNVATFVGLYIVAFLLLWRLAIVGFPFVILLVIPGLMYGRTLMKIARKMRDEYNKANTVAEQAISSGVFS